MSPAYYGEDRIPPSQKDNFIKNIFCRGVNQKNHNFSIQAAAVVLSLETEDSHSYPVMRTCLGRTTVYAKPFLPIGKLPLGAFKGRVVGDQKSIFRHTTCNFDQTIKPKPQGVGGVAPHAPDLMTSYLTYFEIIVRDLTRIYPVAQ